ncbi:heterokaryon incompatibility, partial [Phaeosphaeriaceae sp. PMI808]
YIATSYTWGKPNATQTVSLNGTDFVVRQNLFDFPQAFSTTKITRTKRLGIDQLCIDQTNTRERNHQVTLMPEIYRNSQFVVAWLDRSS